MKISTFLICLAALICASPSVAAPLEAYGRLPFMEDIAISGDGKRLAVIVTDGEQRRILIKSADSGAGAEGAAVLNAGAAKIRALKWIDAEHLLITYSVTSSIPGVIAPKSEYFLGNIFDVSAKKIAPLMGRVEGHTLNTVFGEPMIRTVDGKASVFFHGMSFPDSIGVVTLFQVTPGNSRTNIVETGSEKTRRYLLDESGKAVARTEYDSRTGRWAISAKTAGRWRELAKGEHPFGPPYLVGPGRTPGSLMVQLDAGEAVVTRELSLAHGAWSEDLPISPDDDVIRAPSGRLIGMRSLKKDDLRYEFYDKADQAVWDAVRKAYPGDQVQLADWSDDHRKIIVRVDSATEGPAYAMVDLASKKANWLGNIYQGVAEADISPIKPIAYKAADGLEIPGYLTVPHGKPAKNLPLVVLPHGGPAARDTLGFDWWSQALAAQGYAVLQPNFRGSDGLGADFLEAGYGEFGRKMQTDLSDGVRHLVGEGLVDPKRVCIVGASYGGYAALAGATLDPGVYRCAASISGISDPRRMLTVEKRDSGDATFRYWKNFMGVDGLKDPDLASISPIAHLDQVQAPILLVHGKDDTVVLYEQSRMMADALKKAGKPVEFVTLDGEDHWLSRGQTRQEMLRAVVDFLRKNNPPD